MCDPAMAYSNSPQASAGRFQCGGYFGPRNSSPADGAVAPLQQLGDPRHRPLATPHHQQRADDVAHHVMQERIGLHFHHHLVAGAGDGNLLQVAARMGGLALRAAEGGKIALARQRLRGFVHRRGVERHALPAQVLPLQPRPRAAVEDPVAVAARARREARIEVVGHRHAPPHRHGRRQVGGGAEDPAARVAGGLGIEMHHLAARVHAGIGAAGADGVDGRRGHLRQRHLQRGLEAAVSLQRAGRAQPLPAGKAAAVVFDPECQPHRFALAGAPQPTSLLSMRAASSLTASSS
jgi:hypothetical protein